MTERSPLTPQAALGWLASLSVDIRAAAVLDASGAVLAGDPALAGMHEGAGVVTARSEHYAIVARAGPKALERLLRADLNTALEALEARWKAVHPAFTRQ